MSDVAWFVGDLRTGDLTTELPVVDGGWEAEVNANGSVRVTLAGPVVRSRQARTSAAVAKCYLAAVRDDRVVQAGPIWSHGWSWQAQQLAINAGGLWSLFDHRLVLPVLAAGQRVQDADTTISAKSLGGIARALVAQALTHTGGDLPLILPADEAGTNTETFRGFDLPALGEQLRQVTQRQVGAPDIRFTPRWKTDRTGIEWVLEVGTTAQPELVQVGGDWVLDTTAKRPKVSGIDVDVDGSGMAFRAWVTGTGSERDLLVGTALDDTLIDAGYPLLEATESHSDVVVQATLDGYAGQVVQSSGRPIETWRVTVHASAVADVAAGDYVQVVLRGDAYLPDGTYRARVLRISGDVSDFLVLDLAPILAVV